MVVAPNWVKQFWDIPTSHLSYDPGFGYTVGMDYTRKLGKRWYLNGSLRYNNWQTSQKRSGFVFETDILGHHNPDGSISQDTIFYHDKSWQLLAGFGWHSKPRKWLLNVGIDAGATIFPRKTTNSSVATRLTLGAYIGPEWCINRHFHLFMQPGGRLVFPKLGNSEIKSNRFLALQLETGVRYNW